MLFSVAFFVCTSLWWKCFPLPSGATDENISISYFIYAIMKKTMVFCEFFATQLNMIKTEDQDVYF